MALDGGLGVGEQPIWIGLVGEHTVLVVPYVGQARADRRPDAQPDGGGDHAVDARAAGVDDAGCPAPRKAPRCTWASMKPGVIACSVASMTRVALHAASTSALGQAHDGPVAHCDPRVIEDTRICIEIENPTTGDQQIARRHLGRRHRCCARRARPVS